ncbi:MAG TPA: Asp-tRNA(Asn)/Glu-tRNA(Gln) amidotransferase GatCAB subunit B [Bacteroidetes bacterium]|nr:Asp-tRNA(Asn)/Glu-tRNA(Gln) amidotransferase GatCAB subunit B [Bacteroidota bacterium]
MLEKYEPVIGLEIHAQMKTKSKAFCGCSTEFNAPANSNVCPVCLGHPGVLPVLNSELVNFIVKMGLATNCKIREKSIFARKNYFYPDLSKGYQITQFETPICYDGFFDIELKDHSTKKIGITRIHMEEDAGKSIHDFSDDDSLIDFNRCGVPLIEIVSEPDIRSIEEATAYLNKVKQILVYLEINDGNMEEGSLRCDANISIRKIGEEKYGTRTEIKNLNSFRNVADALEAEIKRQYDVLESGGEVYYTTMNYDASKKVTTPMRSKEEAHDYRYFPEPDLVSVEIKNEILDKIKSELPELPESKKIRFYKEYSLPEYDIDILIQEKPLSNFYEEIVTHLDVKDEKNYKTVSNIILSEVLRILNEEKIGLNEIKISPLNISELIGYISRKEINYNTAKDVFNEMFKSGKSAGKIIKEKNLVQVSDDGFINEIILKVLSENKTEAERYKAGEKKLQGVLVGKIMKESKGKANPQKVNELLIKNLES